MKETLGIEGLIARTFATRDAAHLLHWRTGSYAAHMALGALYEGLIDTLDDLVEAHQGVCGKADVLTVPAVKTPALVEALQKQLTDDLDWIAQNRRTITAGQPALDNLLQALEGVYLKAQFMLDQFK